MSHESILLSDDGVEVEPEDDTTTTTTINHPANNPANNENQTTMCDYDSACCQCETRIPRIVHQVWFDMGNGPSPPAAKYAASQRSLARFAPRTRWRYMRWDETSSRRLLERVYSWFIPVWDAYRSIIFRVDAIRYFALHHYGGVYLDYDVTLTRFLDAMIVGPPSRAAADGDAPRHVTAARTPSYESTRQCVLVRSALLTRMVSNFVMASEPNHAFFGWTVSLLGGQMLRSRWNQKNTIIGTMLIAGPHLLARALRSYPGNKSLVTVLSSDSFNGPAAPNADMQLYSSPGRPRRRQPRNHASATSNEVYGFHQFHSSWIVPSSVANDIKRFVLPTLVAVLLVALALFLFARWRFPSVSIGSQKDARQRLRNS